MDSDGLNDQEHGLHKAFDCIGALMFKLNANFASQDVV